MTPGASAPRVAIVGAGPRGLYALERLTSHAARNGTPLTVDVYDPAPTPGAGPVYDPAQPSYLRMNFAAGLIDAWWPDEGAVPAALRRPLVDWLADADLGSDALAPSSDATSAGDGSRLGDRYLPRAAVGRYLQDSFALVVRFAPPRVRVRHRRATVTGIAPQGDRWIVDDGEQQRTYDEVLVTGAHREKDRRALACGWCHAAPLVRAVFPVDRWLSVDRVPPGSTVALRGIALTAIDAILALTEGRGGRFVAAATPSGLRYEPGHTNPVTIVPYSRTGRPMRPKPDAAVFARLAERLTGVVEHATERLPERLDGTRSVTILARTVGEVAGAVLDVDGTTAEERERLAHWTDALTTAQPVPIERTPREQLCHGYAVATGTASLDAEAALGIAWRLVYPAVVDRFGGAPLGADGWRSFRALAAELERVGFGPCAENVAKLLALVDAGWVRLDHASGGRLVDRIGVTELHSAAGAVAVDRVIDGVLPGPGVERSGRAPLERMLAADLVAVAPGQRGVRVDPVDATALDAAGDRIPGLAAIGRSTEDATIGNDTLNRALHPQVDRWAQRVITRAAVAEAPAADPPSARAGSGAGLHGVPISSRGSLGGPRPTRELAVHEDAAR